MLKRSLIIPDCHRPFHSRKAWELLLEVGSFIQPDEIVILGDFADFHSVSRHLKDPRLPHLLQTEIDSANEGLDHVDKISGSAKKVFLEGNHEARLEKLIFEKCPQLFGITQVSHLFRLEQRGWGFHSFGNQQAYKVLGLDLIARHRPLASNPRQSLLKAGASLVYGDIHKIEEVHAVALDKRRLVGFSPGWLGERRSTAFDYMQNEPQWQLGFAIVSREPSSKIFHHEIVHIKDNYSCIAAGKRFKA